MTIGERIKALRKKKDMTQEKLADFLHVSYQAVSKWECGIANPDLSLIVPLTRLFNVSADELLGLTNEEVDKRKAYFDAEYFDFWLKDHEADLEIARQAVAEYPSDFRYLHWLASDEWYVGYSLEYYGTDKGKDLIESSAKHNLMILENCDDPEMKKEAISGLVFAYSSMDNLDEAKKYAEMYPDESERDRDDLLLHCLRGDEQYTLRKKIFRKKLLQLSFSLESLWRNSLPPFYEALDAHETIIKAIITDGNYQRLHGDLSDIYLEHAKISMQNNDPDEAIKNLTICLGHANEYDKMVEKGIEEYTCPILNGYREDYRNRRSVGFTHTEYIRDCIMDDKLFAPLHDKEVLKKMLE